MTVTSDSKPLLEVRGLQMHFPVTEGIVINRKVGEVKAVDGIDFTVVEVSDPPSRELEDILIRGDVDISNVYLANFLERRLDR